MQWDAPLVQYTVLADPLAIRVSLSDRAFSTRIVYSGSLMPGPTIIAPAIMLLLLILWASPRDQMMQLHYAHPDLL